MKHLTTFALSAVVLIALTLTQVSYAQNNPQGKPQNRGQVKPNFVDANGDGICDNNTSGTCTGGQCGKMGQGSGTCTGGGTCTGTGTRLRQHLRDGSCGQVPKQDGAGKASAGRAGQSAKPAPAK